MLGVSWDGRRCVERSAGWRRWWMCSIRRRGVRRHTEMWQAFDGIERLAANAKTLLAARVEQAGEWKRAGARSAAEHLAKMSGTTTVAARRSLETSREVAELPEVADALRGGELSTTQVDAIAPAAAADPSAERTPDLAGADDERQRTAGGVPAHDRSGRSGSGCDPRPDSRAAVRACRTRMGNGHAILPCAARRIGSAGSNGRWNR